MNGINKILIIGLGSIGRRHFLIAKKKFPQAQIKVLRSKIKKSDFSNEVSLYKLKDAVDFDPQIVVIANPATFHISSAIPFLKKNRYLFIEKPLSHDLEKAKIFLKICKNKKTFVQVGYNLRFLSSLRAFKNFLDKKLIGDIWSIKSEVGQYLPSWRPKNNYRKSVSATKRFGGGVVNELSHEIHYLLWIFGDIKWVRALLSKQSNLDIDVEDSAYIQMSFKNSNNTNLIASLNMDFIRHDRKRECLVFGSKGTIRWNGLTGCIEFFKIKTKVWKKLFNSENLEQSYENEWDNLKMSYLKKCQPIVNGAEGIRVLNVISGIKKSSKLDGIKIKII